MKVGFLDREKHTTILLFLNLFLKEKMILKTLINLVLGLMNMWIDRITRRDPKKNIDGCDN